MLPGGFESGAFGLDEGGWVVRFADVVDPENPAAEPWGVVSHSFLWTGKRDRRHLRVLPSPHAVEHGITDWRQWYAGAAHGVHGRLRQVGTQAHDGVLDDGRPRSSARGGAPGEPARLGHVDRAVPAA